MLILPSYGEPAESWFETAADLNTLGYVVWVLEPIGQGGSGRWTLPRDLGHAPGFGADVAATRQMAAQVIRRRPLYLIASRSSAPAALEALAGGLKADGVILSAPTLGTAPPPATPELVMSMGLARLRAPGERGWSRQGPDDLELGLTHDGARGRVRLAWQTANPDLRMGGPSWGWRRAFAAFAAKAAAEPPAKLGPKMLILQPGPTPRGVQALCVRLKGRCRVVAFAGAGAALQEEADPHRREWLGAIEGFIEADIARFPLPPPRARLATEG